MKYCILLSVIILFFSCGPDDPIQGCSLEKYNGEVYEGYIRFCNAIPGQQQDFVGTAQMTISDSLLTFQINSAEPNISFSHLITVKDVCTEPETNVYIHALYSVLEDSIVGQINLDGTSLFLELMAGPCLDRSTFSGVIIQ